ncbi:MFS transporter [Francisella philomiragia]|uniref:LacY proton/sugar symporter family protein n=1 Tax=Francisella philomiragia TaxID=28110 RepID=A0AAW3D978_9GAMM|nr:MFS transporter [Francisella philomiragia]KFJ42055.1 lacY proton/sugar symporter family protein [Francisella philomiragia]MBK2253994.1 MFS transporter [Francisella philomiragia]MBK2272306.1 MFS transporter [Francisella philomiragia]MBK2276148.1 MFS transporter [Francisella philomiragia]MBK2280095.1 MFS transporter [Francisella philomiragia]
MASINTNNQLSTFIVPENLKLKAVSICFFAAFITGGFGAMLGLVSPQISSHYHVNVSHIVYIDVLNILGLLIGNALSSKTMSSLGCRNTLLIALVIGLIAQFTIATGFPLYIYALCALLNGTCVGFLVPAVSQTIHAAYAKSGKSESRLNVLNFFFGAGSAFVPFIGGHIVEHFSWRAVFIGMGCLYLVLLVIIFLTKFEDKSSIKIDNIDNKLESSKPKLLNLSVVLIALAIMIYVYIEYIVSYWFSPYLQEAKHLKVTDVGLIIGLFWGIIAISRLIVGLFVLTRIKPAVYIMISSFITLIGFIIFLIADSLYGFILGGVVLGFGCAAMFPTLLGYGINNANYSSPKVSSFLIMSGSIGASICLFISGFLGQHIDKQVPIILGPVLCVIIIVIILMAHIRKSTSQQNRT